MIGIGIVHTVVIPYRLASQTKMISVFSRIRTVANQSKSSIKALIEMGHAVQGLTNS